jgi:hypothetical protein
MPIFALLAVMPPASAQSFYVMYDFSGPDGANPFGSLLLNQDVLYGATSEGRREQCRNRFSV